MKKGRRSVCVGVMSGTSVDGIDVAIVDIFGDEAHPSVSVLHFETIPFSEDARKLVFRLFQADSSSSEDICDMNVLLGELFAEAVLQVIQQADIDIHDVTLVSSHGQTIFHKPNPHVLCGRKITSTLQIGESAIIAERTGLPVVSDFRVRDMAAGGQGAPLVPYVDELLFSSENVCRIVANIGGITNLTFLPPKGGDASLLAFDTGPGNMIIDGLVHHYTHGEQRFDAEGKMAQAGRVHEAYLGKWMNEPYILQQPPKTTGRELFGEQCVATWIADCQRLELAPEDVVATATEFTIRTFAKAAKDFALPNHAVSDILIGGGGSHNPVIMAGIQRALPNQQVMKQEVTGISSDAKEAVAFALLGYQCFHRRPNNVPSATGAKRTVSMGKITWP